MVGQAPDIPRDVDDEDADGDEDGDDNDDGDADRVSGTQSHASLRVLRKICSVTKVSFFE